MDHTTSAVRIWDLPTRLFHVTLGLAVIGLIITGEVGGDAMRIHFWLGYVVLALVFFRIVWGLFGGHWSRFVNFLPSPQLVRNYIAALRRKEQPRSISHNPLGALSVLAMLTILLLQVASGLISDDEISISGPLTSLVPGAWVSFATNYHTEIGKVLLIFLLVLHVASVLFYRFFKNEDLIAPMIHGDKQLPSTTRPSRDSMTSRAFALGVLVACAYAVYRLVQLGG